MSWHEMFLKQMRVRMEAIIDFQNIISSLNCRKRQGLYYKTFTTVSSSALLHVSVIFIGRHFYNNLIFVGKARRLPNLMLHSYSL